MGQSLHLLYCPSCPVTAPGCLGCIADNHTPSPPAHTLLVSPGSEQGYGRLHPLHLLKVTKYQDLRWKEVPREGSRWYLGDALTFPTQLLF